MPRRAVLLVAALCLGAALAMDTPAEDEVPPSVFRLKGVGIHNIPSDFRFDLDKMETPTYDFKRQTVQRSFDTASEEEDENDSGPPMKRSSRLAGAPSWLGGDKPPAIKRMGAVNLADMHSPESHDDHEPEKSGKEETEAQMLRRVANEHRRARVAERARRRAEREAKREAEAAEAAKDKTLRDLLENTPAPRDDAPALHLAHKAMMRFKTIMKYQMKLIEMDRMESDSCRTRLMHSARIAALVVVDKMLKAEDLDDGLGSTPVEWYSAGDGSREIRPGDIVSMTFDGPAFLKWQHSAVVLHRPRATSTEKNKLFVLGCSQSGSDNREDCSPTYLTRQMGDDAGKGRISVLHFTGPPEIGRYISDLAMAWSEGARSHDNTGLQFANVGGAVKRGLTAFFGTCQTKSASNLDKVKDRYVVPAYEFIMGGKRELPRESIVCSTAASMMWVGGLGALDNFINQLAESAELPLNIRSDLLYRAGAFLPSGCKPADLKHAPFDLVNDKVPSIFWQPSEFDSIRPAEYYASDESLRPIMFSYSTPEWMQGLKVLRTSSLFSKVSSLNQLRRHKGPDVDANEGSVAAAAAESAEDELAAEEMER